MSAVASDPDTFRILVTTDNHVGYQESDPIRGNDSWKTFEEIMYIAKEQNIDFVLQAGDLFHVNKPSKKSMFHVLKSLRTCCYGSKPIEFELLSDASLSIDNRGLNHCNFQDPNINVAVPVFAIAGNHDDSTGDELLDPMDLLSVTGLINHFGKNLNNDKVTVAPLLFQKGTTKLALYGLSNIRDERLYKTFIDGDVKFLKIDEKSKRMNLDQSDFFNLLAVHQNHTEHTDTSYLPENFLPKFLDLVVWGHEHECIPYFTSSTNGFKVLQPGSSVATSLSDGEVPRKHIFILEVKNKNVKMINIPLKTVRPFILKTIDLTKEITLTGNVTRDKKKINDFLIRETENLIEEARNNWKQLNQEEEEEGQDDDDDDDAEQALSNGQEDNIPLPLIRLKVEYTDGYEIENPRRFSNRFVGKVANVNDVALFHRKKTTNSLLDKKKLTKKKGVGALGEDNEEEEEVDLNTDISTLINAFLTDNDLNLISKKQLGDIIKQFIEKDDKSVLKKYVDDELNKDFKILLSIAENSIKENLLNEDSIDFNDNSDKNEKLSDLKKGFKEILRQINQDKKQDSKESQKLAQERKKQKHNIKSTEYIADSSSEDFNKSEDGDFIMENELKQKTPKNINQKRKIREASVEVISSSEKEQEPLDISDISEDDRLSDLNDDELISMSQPKKQMNTKSKSTPTTRGERGRGRARGRGSSRNARKSRVSKDTTKEPQDTARGEGIMNMISSLANRKK
ncbi:hypothetical protein PACTADRAFT_48327 [Pachysolen tannophilus NRRL Y-2460]|uniref:Double-strand break repair protein n=1 Tax=Pachysolen tannophilus NRRL Y-2460 TaxID=669874 RepID=A0A1E4U3M7_PACTA|nr:hypothetical protein PACTADRAFT_48327 [Pachysolen tannophilus NRRL Y-2460]